MDDAVRGWRQVHNAAFRAHGRRVRFQPRVERQSALLVVACRKNADAAIKADRDIEIDRTTTYFAILYVVLLWNRVVNQDADALATIGTLNGSFIHYCPFPRKDTGRSTVILPDLLSRRDETG